MAEHETIKNYPMDNFYSYIKTNTRFSGTFEESENNIQDFSEKNFFYGTNNGKIISKTISYVNDTNDNFSRFYTIPGNTNLILEKNIQNINSTIFGISKVTLTGNIIGKNTKEIQFNLNSDGEIPNISELKKEEVLDFSSLTSNSQTQKTKLSINRNLEIGSTDFKDQLIKLINNSGSHLSLGSESTNNLVITFTNEYGSFEGYKKLTHDENTGLNYIDYENYAEVGNKIISPSDTISNLWLLGSSGSYWTASKSWLETNKKHIEYLNKPRPTFDTIEITGGNNDTSLPDDYFRDIQPRGYNGKVQIKRTETINNMSYVFEDENYYLKSLASEGRIDYQNGSYKVIYLDGYKEYLKSDENHEVGDVFQGTGGLLNLIPKEAKITFKETKDNQIRIIPTEIDNETGKITKATVECNEFIFDTEE